jgi:hypothetical protein
VTLKADIPFEFHVGSKLMPAGAYTVSASPSQDYLRVDSDSSNSTAYITAIRKQSGEVSGVSTITFHRYGDHYFLANIQTGWSPLGYEVFKTRTEKETTLSARVRQDYQIVARR